MKPKYSISLLLIIFLLSAVSGCGGNKGKTSDSESLPVRAAQVHLQTIQNVLEYVGDVKGEDEALVYPKVNGKIIEKLKEEGDAVNKGDILAYVDRDEVGFKFEKAPVESPLTGFVGKVNVDIGTQVTPTTPVALVVDVEEVEIELSIPETYISKISVGQNAEIRVRSYPDEKFVGTVSKVSPVLDLATRTALVKIVIPNADYRLKSGMFAKVRLVIEEHKNVPVVIKEAILGKKPNEYVYVVADGVARPRPVKLGLHEGAYYEVMEGLSEGDMVVIMGQQRLYDGASVTVEEI